jgi:hypothetical protein
MPSELRRAWRSLLRRKAYFLTCAATLTLDDTADRPPVAIISRRFADLLMPGLDPIGRLLLRNDPPAVGESTAPERFRAFVLSTLALLGLASAACVGPTARRAACPIGLSVRAAGGSRPSGSR